MDKIRRLRDKFLRGTATQADVHKFQAAVREIREKLNKYETEIEQKGKLQVPLEEKAEKKQAKTKRSGKKRQQKIGKKPWADSAENERFWGRLLKAEELTEDKRRWLRVWLNEADERMALYAVRQLPEKARDDVTRALYKGFTGIAAAQDSRGLSVLSAENEAERTANGIIRDVRSNLVRRSDVPFFY